jgi:chromosomal replication initiator protein
MNFASVQHHAPSPVCLVGGRSLSVRNIAHIAAELSSITFADLIGPRKFPHLVRARALTMWAVKTLRPELSLSQIGAQLGGKDHTTVMHQHQMALRLLETDPDFVNRCHDLLSEVSWQT